MFSTGYHLNSDQLSQATSSSPASSLSSSMSSSPSGSLLSPMQKLNLIDFWPEFAHSGLILSWWHGANSRASLRDALLSDRLIVQADIALAELTRYPVPVMTGCSSASSADLSLEAWLLEASRARPQKGLKLTFGSTRVVEPAFRVLARHAHLLSGPLILSADILAWPDCQEAAPVDAWTFLMLCRTRFPSCIISIGCFGMPPVNPSGGQVSSALGSAGDKRSLLEIELLSAHPALSQLLGQPAVASSVAGQRPGPNITRPRACPQKASSPGGSACSDSGSGSGSPSPIGSDLAAMQRSLNQAPSEPLNLSANESCNDITKVSAVSLFSISNQINHYFHQWPLELKQFKRNLSNTKQEDYGHVTKKAALAVNNLPRLTINPQPKMLQLFQNKFQVPINSGRQDGEDDEDSEVNINHDEDNNEDDDILLMNNNTNSYHKDDTETIKPLNKRSNACYTPKMIDKMASLAKEYNLIQPITFEVDANLLRNSISEMQRLLYQVGPNSTLTVKVQHDDLIGIDDLLIIREAFALNQLIFDLPDKLTNSLKQKLTIH